MTKKIIVLALVCILALSTGIAIMISSGQTRLVGQYLVRGIVYDSYGGAAEIYNDNGVWVCKNIAVYSVDGVKKPEVNNGTFDKGGNFTDYDEFEFDEEGGFTWRDGDVGREGICVGETEINNVSYVFITNFTFRKSPLIDKWTGACTDTEWEPIPSPKVYKKGDNWINISIPKFTNPKLTEIGGIGITPNANNTIGYAIWRDDTSGDKPYGIADYSTTHYYFYNDTLSYDTYPPYVGNYSISPIAKGNYIISGRSINVSSKTLQIGELEIELLAPSTTIAVTGGTTFEIKYRISKGLEPYTVKLSYTTPSPEIIGYDNRTAEGIYSFNWSVPRRDATDCRISLEITDGDLITKSAESVLFKIDSKAPEIKSVHPKSGSTDVSIYEDIIIEFNESMNKTSVENAFSINPAVSNLAWYWLTENRTKISHAPFEPNTTYNCALSAEAKDSSIPGNPLEAYSWSFKTAPGISLSLHFPYEGARVTGNRTQLLQYSVGGGSPPYNITIQFYDGTTWKYEANLTNIDEGLNTYNWSAPALDIAVKLKLHVVDMRAFTTELIREFILDSTHPELLEYGGSKGIVVTTESIILVFSEAVNITTVEQNFKLVDNETNTKVNGTWDWEDSKIAIFKPAAALVPNMNYTATITSDALDISIPGNSLIEKVWYFTALEGRGDFIVTVTFPALPKKGDVGKITVVLFNTGAGAFNSSGTIVIKFSQSPDGRDWTLIDRKIIPGIWANMNETRDIDVKFETAGDYHFKVEVDSTSALDIFNGRDYFVTTDFIRVEELPSLTPVYALIALMVLIVIVIGFLVIASYRKK
jgi:hypothetical protein